MDRFRALAASINKEMGMQLNVSRAEVHQCIAAYSMYLSFSSSLILSLVEIIIAYDERAYEINFLTTDSDEGFGTDLITSVAIQSLSIRYDDTNTVWYTMIFACQSEDECDWDYARRVASRFTSITYQDLQTDLSPLLYYSGAGDVTQCYQMDDPSVALVLCKASASSVSTSIAFEYIQKQPERM